MDDLIVRLKEHSNKIFWVLVTLLLGAWFSNEYLTTKRLVREQSSILYSNLMDQYKNLLVTDSAVVENADNKKDNLAELQRFKSEVTRLIDEYEETQYSTFAKLLEASFNLSKNDTSKVEQLKTLYEGKNYSDLQKHPFNRIEQEIAQLISARTLIASDDPNKVKEGLESLKVLINTADLVPIDASITYLVSLPVEGVDQFTKFKEIHELLKRKPELQSTLETELAKFGVSLPNT